MATRYVSESQLAPEILRDQEKVARNPLAWRLRAMSQRRAAQLLKDQQWMDLGRLIGKKEVYVPFGTGEIESPYVPRLESVVILLHTHAIQSLLTAMCIDRDGAVEDSARAFDVLQEHSLFDLCERLEIDLDGSEMLMLRNMNGLLVSSNQYPVPLVHYAIHPRPLPGGPIGSRAASPIQYQIWDAEKFLDRLWMLYETITPVPEQLR
jgi:hypothetical protein